RQCELRLEKQRALAQIQALARRETTRFITRRIGRALQLQAENVSRISSRSGFVERTRWWSKRIAAQASHSVAMMAIPPPAAEQERRIDLFHLIERIQPSPSRGIPKSGWLSQMTAAERLWLRARRPGTRPPVPHGPASNMRVAQAI